MLANDTKCKRRTNDATEKREQHGEPMGKEAILRNLTELLRNEPIPVGGCGGTHRDEQLERKADMRNMEDKQIR